MAEEERAFRATVRDRLTEVLRALVAELDLSTFALLQVRTRHWQTFALNGGPFVGGGDACALVAIAWTVGNSLVRLFWTVGLLALGGLSVLAATRSIGHFCLFFRRTPNRHRHRALRPLDAPA